MGQYRKYTQPPPAELLDQNAIPPPGEALEDILYEANSGLADPRGYDPFMMGGGLPPLDYYGQPKQQWNAEMMDRLIDTQIKVRKDDQGRALPIPKLWLFQTEVFRHFQLTNLRSRDQTEMERDIADIQMLAHQDGNEMMCEELQQRVFAKIAMFKSRADLPIQHRERDAWFTNVSEMKTHEIKRPQASGGFFSNMLGKKDRRDY